MRRLAAARWLARRGNRPQRSHSQLARRSLSSVTAEAVRQHVSSIESSAPPSLPSTSVPSLTATQQQQLSTLRSLLSHRRHVLVLTGAGLSTESGIPDYRSPGRPPHNPITHQTFARSEAARQRYWARSMIGYQRMVDAQPNAGHRAIGSAQQAGRVQAVVTQNVDELHERGGAADVVHLHGSIHQVECMQCADITSRSALQRQLETLNPDFTRHIRALLLQATVLFQQQQQQSAGAQHDAPSPPPSALIPHNHDEDAPMERRLASLRPDGDIELQNESFYSGMRIPPCALCGGVLKPRVVFFGANVPRVVHDRVDALLAASDALLVVGTSLTVWSAFRIVRAALARQQAAAQPITLASAAASACPVAIINDGPTRADGLVAPELRIAGRAGSLLRQLWAAP